MATSYAHNTPTNKYIIHIRTEELPESAFFNNLTTDFEITLSNPITCQPNEHIIFTVSSLSVPMSFYNVDEFSNKIKVDSNNGGVISSITYTIPVGNYNSRDLVKTVVDLLKTDGTPWVGSYNSRTNKSVFSNASLINFTFDFTTANSCHRQLGFTKSYFTSSATVLTSPNQCVLTPYNSLYLHSNLNILSNFDSFGRQTDILERIPLDSPNSVLFYRPPVEHTFIVDSLNINSFRMRLTFNKDTPVNLNGGELEITIQFAFIKQLERTPYALPEGITKQQTLNPVSQLLQQFITASPSSVIPEEGEPAPAP